MRNQRISRLFQRMILGIFFCSWAPGVEAQTTSQTSSGYVQGSFIKALRMDPGIQSMNFPFWADQTTSFSLTVSSLAKNLSLRLVDPQGSVFVHGSPNTEQFQNLTNPDLQKFPDVPGAHYYMNLENPIAGQWNLQVSVPVALTTPIPIHINLALKNQVGTILSGGGGSRPLGSTLAFSVAVLDGVNKVNNLQISASLYRLDNLSLAPLSLTFADDGGGADFSSGDGLYSSSVRPDQPGEYMLQVEVSGDASTGHFQRSCASGFRIAAKTASITGNFSITQRTGVPE